MDHDPIHSQYIIGIMNEYLKNTKQKSSVNLDQSDYAYDSLYNKDEILSNYKVNGTQLVKKIDNDHNPKDNKFIRKDNEPDVKKYTRQDGFDNAEGETMDVIYGRILNNLSTKNFSAVSQDLQTLSNVEGNISAIFQNPQKNADQTKSHYKESPLEWMTDLLTYETFDTRIGGSDSDDELGNKKLREKLGEYYNSISETYPKIKQSLEESANKFFLSFAEKKNNPADFS